MGNTNLLQQENKKIIYFKSSILKICLVKHPEREICWENKELCRAVSLESKVFLKLIAWHALYNMKDIIVWNNKRTFWSENNALKS